MATVGPGTVCHHDRASPAPVLSTLDKSGRTLMVWKSGVQTPEAQLGWMQIETGR